MRSHRELTAWQRAHSVVVGVHRYGAMHWRPGYAAILDQLRRAALSVDLNIVEGFASGRGRRCKNHLRIAFGSAAETTALLELLMELDAPAVSDIQALQKVSAETRILTLRLWQRTKTSE